MKYAYRLILGFSAILSLANCYTTADSSGGTTTQSVVYQVSALSSVTIYADSVLLPEDIATPIYAGTSFTWTQSTGAITYTNSQTNATVTCTTPAAVLTQLDQFWASAQICSAQFINTEDGPIACPAVAELPLATFTGPSGSFAISQSSAVGPCTGMVYYLCDPNDLATLNSIGLTLLGELSTLTCH
jgi:hypothetical protein